MGAPKTFREACCEKLNVSPDAYEPAVLWHCFPPAHLFLGKLRWRLDRGYFANDLELLRAVADCTTLDELQDEIALHYSTKPNFGFERAVLRARMSGQRLANLASTVLPPA
jgi:hypothetical protein